MYSFQGCFLLNDDICLNNYFTLHQENSSSVGDCENLAKINAAPFFALTGGNTNKASCLLGNDSDTVSDTITSLTNSKNKIDIQNISEIDLSKKPNICGYNNPNKKTDIYAGANAFSLYTSANTMLLYKNKDLLKLTYESAYFFNNKLKQLDEDFKKIIDNLKNSYIEYIRSKAESQAFGDTIEEPDNVITKRENIIQILTDLIRLYNNYNNLINDIVKSSQVVFEKLNVFRSSTGLLQSQFNTNNDILDNLLNANRADNGQLLNNTLKRNVLIAQNILLILILISLFFIKKNK